MASARKRFLCILTLLALTGLIAGGIVAWGEAVYWGDLLEPGESIELVSLVALGDESDKPADLMVVFVETRCPTCGRLVENLKSFRRGAKPSREWHLVAPNPDPTLEAVPAWIEVHYDPSGRLFKAFRVTVVPAAFHLGERGRLRESRSGLAATGWIVRLLDLKSSGGLDP